MQPQEAQINSQYQKSISNVNDIATDDIALKRLLNIAHEYGDVIYEWFSKQDEVYNFVGVPELNLSAICASFWEDQVFGGTFIVVCRIKTGDTYEQCTRKFPFKNPQPKRKYF